MRNSWVAFGNDFVVYYGASVPSSLLYWWSSSREAPPPRSQRFSRSSLRSTGSRDHRSAKDQRPKIEVQRSSTWGLHAMKRVNAPAKRRRGATINMLIVEKSSPIDWRYVLSSWKERDQRSSFEKVKDQRSSICTVKDHRSWSFTPWKIKDRQIPYAQQFVVFYRNFRLSRRDQRSGNGVDEPFAWLASDSSYGPHWEPQNAGLSSEWEIIRRVSQEIKDQLSVKEQRSSLTRFSDNLRLRNASWQVLSNIA